MMPQPAGPAFDVTRVAHEFGIADVQLRLLTNRVSGAVYRVGDDRYLKVQQVWTGSTQEQFQRIFNRRLEFWSELSAQTGICLPAYRSASGEYAVPCEIDAAPAIATLSGFVEGVVPRKTIDNAWGPRLFRELGRIAGTFHQFASEYPVWQRVSGGPPDDLPDGPEDDFGLILTSVRSRVNVPGCQEELDEIASAIRSVTPTRNNHGFTHMDLQYGNLVGTPNGDWYRWWLIDPDLAMCTWFVVDIAYSIYPEVAATYTRDGEGVAAISDRRDLEERFVEVLRPYLAGYTAVRPITRDDLALLGMMVRYCDVQAESYILAFFDVDSEMTDELNGGIRRFAEGDRTIDEAVSRAVDRVWSDR